VRAFVAPTVSVPSWLATATSRAREARLPGASFTR
jgi:hypothetical protein